MLAPFLDRLTAYFLTDSLRAADADTRRRARLVVLFSLTISLCGPAYGVVYMLLGMHVSTIGAVVAAVVLSITPFVLKRTGSVALGAHLATFGCYAALALVTAPTGGIAAPAVTWLALVPVTALMLGGKRAGSIWTALSLITLGAYFAVDAFKVTPVSEVPLEWLRTLRFAVSSGLVFLIAVLAGLYESNKDKMMSELTATNVALTAARDEAREAHAAAHLVLDNVAQGLVIVGRDGKIRGESSRAFGGLLDMSSKDPAGPVWSFVADRDPSFATALEVSWDALFDDVLPLELILDQMPRECRYGEQTLAFDYVPVMAGEVLGHVLVVVTDVTLQMQAREAERKQLEQLEVFHWIVKDPRFFISFLRDAEESINAIEHDRVGMNEQLRMIHTLKGNASLFGLTTFASYCHKLEQEVHDAGEQQLTGNQRRRFMTAFHEMKTAVAPLLGAYSSDDVVVARAEYDGLLEVLESGDHDLRRRVRAWTWEPAAAHLERLAAQAASLSKRILQRELRVVVESDGTRIPPGAWTSFWSAASHVIRNAIDHGIEAPEDRLAAGKPESGQITLSARTVDGNVLVDVADDGAGIDWDGVLARATALGLPTHARGDLERALFADGLSTRSETTELSGRGVGMSAVLESCTSLGGEVHLDSRRGEGTRFRFTIPVGPKSDSPRAAAVAA